MMTNLIFPRSNRSRLQSLPFSGRCFGYAFSSGRQRPVCARCLCSVGLSRWMTCSLWLLDFLFMRQAAACRASASAGGRLSAGRRTGAGRENHRPAEIRSLWGKPWGPVPCEMCVWEVLCRRWSEPEDSPDALIAMRLSVAFRIPLHRPCGTGYGAFRSGTAAASPGELRGEGHKKGCHDFATALWRKERDSNPRYSYPYTAFRVRPDRPLRHLSLKPSAKIISFLRIRPILPINFHKSFVFLAPRPFPSGRSAAFCRLLEAVFSQRPGF